MTYDMREAISKIDGIPLVKESIPELTKLANGFDPSIPGYLALGKLYQLTNLAESAKAAEPPQGTIKDKTTQAAGLMALMGGRGQMAAQNSATQTMRQPGPVPRNTPEPEMQMEADPEEIMGMGMADGGITSMDIDPRMFNFDNGGIVSFAKGSKKPVEEEPTTALGDMLRSIFGPIGEGFQNTLDYGRVRNERDAARPGMLEPLTKQEKEARATQVSDLNRELARIGGQGPTPEAQAAAKQAAYDEEQARLRAGHKAAILSGNSSDSPYPGAPFPGIPQQVVAPPAPPAPPKPQGGIANTNVRPPAPSGNSAAQPAMPQNEFLDITKKFVNQAPETFDEAAETAKLNARNEAAGIGTYAKVMREQQQQLRKQFEDSRPSMNEGIVGALRAYAKPGARAGDVGGEITGQMRDEREAKMSFEQDQFKVTEAIEKLEEARRTGNVDKIAAAEAAVKKAGADLRNHQMTAAASAANTLGHTQSTMAQIASHEKIEANKLAIEKLKVAAMNKEPAAIRVMHEIEALLAQGKDKEAKEKLERFAQASAADKGVRYTGKNTAPTQKEIMNAIRDQHKLENQMDFMTLAKKNAKPAEKAAAQARIDATERKVREGMTRGTGDGGGGGGGGQPTLAEFMAKAKPANPNASDAELKEYYQQNYGK